MEKQLVLDNPQERLSSLNFKIGWLAAMIDGEGSISLAIQQRKGESPYFVPMVAISGTDKSSIQRSCKFLGDLGMAYYIFKSTKKGRLMRINPNSQANKDCSTIRVWGMKRANRFLKLITPYLIEKKERAELVLSYTERRIEKYQNMMHQRGWHGSLQAYPLTDEDVIDYWKLRKLNNTIGKYKNSKSSESIRRVTYKTLEEVNKLMMYSELTGDSKNTAEMPVSV